MGGVEGFVPDDVERCGVSTPIFVFLMVILLTGMMKLVVTLMIIVIGIFFYH